MGDRLVHYPFKIQTEDEAILYKVDTEFEMRFTKELTSKRVLSTNKKDAKKYLEIEINDDDGNVTIIEIYNEIHHFKTPADFYVPISENSKYFYESLHSYITHEDLNTFLEKTQEIDKIIKKDGFPEFPIPLTTTATHFENFEQAISKSTEQLVVPVVHSKHSDEIPLSPVAGVYETIKSFLTNEQYQAQEEFYKNYFDLYPITRFKNIPGFYEKKNIKFKRLISIYLLKKCIALHAYFKVSGPWRKCWIKMGYDPRIDPENYKYQIIEMRTKKSNFQIFQKPEIVFEVSKNKDWYLLKEYDLLEGFISKALHNFIVYIIDNGDTKLIDKRLEDLQDSDMEIFEL